MPKIFGVCRWPLLCLWVALQLGLLQAQDAADSSAEPDDLEALFDMGGSDDAAGSSDAAQAPSGFAALQGLRLYGEHEFSLPLAFLEGYQDFGSYTRAPRLRNYLELEYERNEVKLLSSWQLDISTNKDSSASAPSQLGDLLDFRPGRNYIDWSPDNWQLAFGLQEFSWGVADGIRPTDNLNPRSIRNTFESEKLPVMAANINWFPLPKLQLQLLLSMSILDVQLAEPLDQILQAQLARQGSRFDISTQAREFDWKNSQIGFRSSFYLAALDFSFSYLFGLSPFYSVSKLDMPSPPDAGTIKLERKSWNHIFGLDAKSSLGPLSLWAEAAFTLTQDYDLSDEELPNHSLSWVLGAEWNYGPGSVITTNIQSFGTWVPGFDDSTDVSQPSQSLQRNLNNRLAGQDNGLQLGFSLYWALDLSKQHLQLKIQAFYLLPLLYDRDQGQRYGGLLLRPELSFSPADALELYCRLNFAYSWREDASGDWQRDEQLRIGQNWYDSHVELGLRYSWSTR